MGKKLTPKQESVVRRVANRLGMSDVTVGAVVSEFLSEQSARPAPKRQVKPPPLSCPDCGKLVKSESGLAAHRKAKHP